MGLSDKIRGLIKIKGKKSKDLADYLGLSNPQALATKFTRCSFTAAEMIKIAEFTGCKLAFIISDSEKLEFNIDDI